MLIDADITIFMSYFQSIIYYNSLCMRVRGGHLYDLVDICLVKKYSHNVNELWEMEDKVPHSRWCMGTEFIRGTISTHFHTVRPHLCILKAREQIYPYKLTFPTQTQTQDLHWICVSPGHMARTRGKTRKPVIVTESTGFLREKPNVE